ncbi:MAG: 3-dehydroquinate synthase [Bacteroidia bacterium]|nr:3-dehydroquinate synthase [Bacteroidia bacterium]MCX7765025.1 3-dehydroquinate synthase [Bacteroidia bacterium]MDW8058132.1 3-dehydroquinate synthase family protein [Bacteroidia bacterium]
MSYPALPKPSAAIRNSTPIEYFESPEALLEKASHERFAVVFCDGKVYSLWKSLIDALCRETPVITIAGGEESKTLPSLRRLWKKLWQYKVDKGQKVLVIGGGSTLDVSGFAAATWKRGVPFVSVPTSLIAQIDAAFGGKVGINFRQGKNLLGTYAHPESIWILPAFLTTLDERSLKAGWVEGYKHALLEGGELWEEIQATSFSALPSTLILQKLVSVKLRYVQEDPYEEKGIRQALNLGHTLGHIWESLSQREEKPLLHGEAVAMGLVQEAFVSVQMGLLPEKVWETILSKLKGEKVLSPLPSFTWKQWEKLLSQDKKIREGRVFIPLLLEVGRVALQAIPVERLKKVVRMYPSWLHA